MEKPLMAHSIMRILIITDKYLPVIGGIQYHIYDLVNFLKDLNCNISIIAFQFEKKLRIQVENINGIKVYKIPNIFSKLFFISFLYLLKIGLNFRPNIIHTHLAQYSIFGNILANLLHKPSILTVHGFDILLSYRINYGIQRYYWARCCVKLGLIHSKKIIATCNYIREKIIALGINKKKIEVVPNWINIKKIRSFSNLNTIYSKYNLDKQKTYIITARRLEKKNGIDIFIKSGFELFQRYPNVEYLICGNGSQYYYLKRLIGYSPFSSRYHLLKFIPKNDLNALIKLSKLFVLPSLIEAFGLSALESMALNTPVIGSRTGGIKEIIQDRFNGLLFNVNSINDLIEKIELLLNESELNERIKLNLQANINNYSIKKLGLKTLEIYLALLFTRN